MRRIKSGIFKVALSVMAIIIAISVFAFGRNDNYNVNAITTTDTTSYVKVGELFDTTNKQFVKTNYQILRNYLAGKANATASDISSMASNVSNAATFRSKTLTAGSYNGTSYSAKTNTKDIIVTIGGLDWQVMYLSEDKSGNPILTVWLDNCVQDAWNNYDDFNLSGLGDCGFVGNAFLSSFSNGWTTNNGSFTYLYPTNMYGTSFVNAVALNNGGVYADTKSTIEIAKKNKLNPFALFTMEEFGLTDYLVTPRQVSWQEFQDASEYGAEGTFVNDAWDKDLDGYASFGYDYTDAWADSYLWLPSVTETGYDEIVCGMWEPSSSQRESYDGENASIGESYCQANTLLRSAVSSASEHIDKTAVLNVSGIEGGFDLAYCCYGIRPAMHLNLNAVETSVSVVSIEGGILTVSNATYTGSAITPTTTLVVNGTTLTGGRDYTISCSNNTNVGTAIITITGIGNYTGTLTTSFKINAKSLSGATFSTIAAQTFTGGAITPTPTVTLDGKTLTAGTDFTYSYSNNVNASSSATVKITGKGNYTGTASTTFTIKPKDMSAAVFPTIPAVTYTGSEIRKDPPTLSLGNLTLTVGMDFEYSYLNNVNAGTATVVATGKGNYTGSASATYTIESKSISGASFTCQDEVYTGLPVGTPTMSLIVDGITLQYPKDYSIKFYDIGAINPDLVSYACTYTIKATGKGNYKDSVSTTFTIKPRSLSSGVIFGSYTTSYTYTGLEITPVPSSMIDDGLGETLSSSDYELSYSNNVDVGQAWIIATGKGNYTGEIRSSFTIKQYSGSLTISGLSSSYEYTRSAIKPDVTVTSELGKTMVCDTDYSVSYSNNTNTGTATITVTGIGNYSGTGSATFTISAYDMKNFPLPSGISFYYTGSAITRNTTGMIIHKGYELKEDKDYTVEYSNNTNAGTGTMTLTGKGNYTGSMTVQFTITPIDIGTNWDLFTVNNPLSEQSFTYTGSEIRPVPEVYYNGIKLVDGVDFDCTYMSNVNVEYKADGTVVATYASVAIAGKGNYSGGQIFAFTITPRDISDATITGITGKTYTGMAQTQSPTITYNSMTLIEGTDYELSYYKNTDASLGADYQNLARVTITGKGNYTASVTESFTISPRNISEVEITYSALEFTYNGSAQGPTITSVKFGGVSVAAASIVANGSMTNVGTYNATVIGAGNLTGTITVSWKIKPKSISGATVTVGELTYTGNQLTTVITVKDGETTLVEDSDYKLVYMKPIDAGSYNIEVSGKGNYTDYKNVRFSVNSVDINSDDVEILGLEQPIEYTGDPLTPVVEIKYNGRKYNKGSNTFTISYSNNTNATERAEVTLVGCGNFTGTRTVYFTITPLELVVNYPDISFSYTSNYVYTGISIEPEMIINIGERELVEGDEYTLTYSNNTNVGTATIVIEGVGNFGGSITKTFDILPKSLGECEMVIDQIYFEYTGSPIIPKVTVTDNGRVLKELEDYTVGITTVDGEDIDAINVGRYLIAANSCDNGNYDSGAELYFYITAKNIADESITIDNITAETYIGSAITPLPVVKYNGVALVKDTDYTLSYADNINAGEATITITGKGNFTGDRIVEFNIKPLDISSGTITCTFNPYDRVSQYEDKVYCTPKLSIEVVVDDKEPQMYNDFYIFIYKDGSIVEGFMGAGEYLVRVEGIKNYSGYLETTLNVEPYDISKTNAYQFDIFEEIQTYYSYNASEHTPIFDLQYSYFLGFMYGEIILFDIDLVKDVDYTLSGEISATDVGTHTIIITGIGDFSGTRVIEYYISPMAISSGEFVFDSNVYDGNEKLSNLSISIQCSETDFINLSKDDFTVVYKLNGEVVSSVVNVGTYTITATGKGNFTGEISSTYTITPLGISDTSITVDSISNETYTGSAINPLPVVKHNGVALVKDTDYTLSYADNINAGEATITITGKGNYTGIASTKFTIEPLSIYGAGITFNSVETSVYDGSEQRPLVVVKHNDKILVKDTDYTISYSNNINAGEATFTITGIGNFTGTNSTSFIIEQRDISDGELIAEDMLTYSGLELIPNTTLIVNGKTLEKDKDYLVVASNNINFGNATLTINGKGNYTGVINSSFYISKAAFSDVVIDSISTQNYTGSEITPIPNITYNTRPLVYGTDFECTYENNVNVGTATIIIMGKGNFDGREEITFEIGSLVIGSFTLGNTSFVYDTTEKFPGIIVKSGTTILTQDVDYTVAGDVSATNVGNYTITITGMGGYSGTKTANWAITTRSISDCTITLVEDTFTYTGAEHKPNIIIVTNGDEYTIDDTNYVVQYADNVNAGTGKITITGKDNLTGTINKIFTINAMTLDSTEVTVEIENQTYTGTNIEPSVVITYKGMTLESGTDYTCEFSDNLNVGTATITVTGKGNYKDTTLVYFDIEQLDIAECEIILSDYELTYNTNVQTVSVEVKFGNTIIDSDNYVVVGNSGIDANTYNVVVRGQGNLTGENNSQSFIIAPKELRSADIVYVAPQLYLHDGYGNAIPVTIDADEMIVGSDGTGVLVMGVDFTVEVINGTVICEDLSNIQPEDIVPTVVVTGIGNYTGTISRVFAIVDNNLATDAPASVTISTETHCFTNGEIKPKVTVVWAGNILSADGENPDYKVEYSNNINVGEATVTITGLNSYNGVVTKTFEITPIDIDCVAFEFAPNYYEYNGSAHYPEFTLEYVVAPSVNCEYCENESCLVANAFMLLEGVGKHYTCEVTNNVNAGEGVVTCKGMGNFTGTITKTFTIEPKDIGTANIEDLTVNAFEYTGQEITPSVVVFYNDGEKIILEKDKDYSVYYENNINVGEATIVVTGIGNYDGEITKTFEIYAKTIESVTLDNNSYIYDTTTKVPVITVKVGARTLVDGADYEVSGDIFADEVGEYVITITGKGNYSGELSVEWNITAKTLGDCYVSIDTDNLVYTGNQIKPAITIKVSEDGSIISSEMYDVVYSDNVNVGEATVTITGKDGLSGSITRTFVITKRSLNDVDVAVILEQQFTGSEIKPTIVVSFNGNELELGKDYTVEYSNNINAGNNAIVEITGKGNYTGTITRTFTILTQNISTATLTIENNTYVYTGSAVDTKAKLVLSGVELLKGTDYSIEIRQSSPTGDVIAEAKNVGNYYLVVTGTGNYTGSKFVGFNIVKANPTVTIKCADSAIFAGKPVNLSIDSASVEGTVYCSQTSYVEGEYSYEYMFVPSDTNNYNVVVGSITLTAIRLQVIGLEFSGEFKKEYVAYETLNTANLVVSLKYNNNETQELYLSEYSFSMINGAILRVGDKVTVTYKHNHEIKADLPITIAQRTVVAACEQTLVDNGDAQNINFTFANKIEGTDVTYTVVYYNLSTGLIVDEIVNAGKYKAILTLTNDNYALEDNEVLFEVCSRTVTSEDEGLLFESESGFASDEEFSYSVETDKEVVLQELGVNQFNTDKQFVSVYTFDFAEDKEVVVTLTLDAVDDAESVTVYKMENNVLVNLPYSILEGNRISVSCNTADKLYVFKTATYVINNDRVEFVSAIVVLLAIIVVGLVMAMIVDSRNNLKAAKKMAVNSDSSNQEEMSEEELLAKYVIMDSEGNVVGLKDGAPEELQQAFRNLNAENEAEWLAAKAEAEAAEEAVTIEPEQPVQEPVVEEPKLTNEEMVANYAIVDENGKVVGLKDDSPEELKQAYDSLLAAEVKETGVEQLSEEEMIAKYVIVDENGNVVGLREGAPEALRQTYEALLNKGDNN